VAGRRQGKSRDEEAGVTPLHGRPPRGTAKGTPSGIGPDGVWHPAVPGQRPPFAPGNTINLTHGATCPAKIRPRAEEIVRSVLEDALMPDHLRSPAFRFALQAWAEAEAAAAMLYDWICEQSIETLVFPRLGATKAPVELWQTMAKTAMTLRGKLGLDPASYARISKDLGIAENASENQLRGAAQRGALIVARRAAIGEGGNAAG